MMIDVESVLAHDGRMQNTGPRFRPSPTARIISGTGYLAGEFPDGITTVEGVPVDATVRVLLRSTDPALDGLVMAETRSRHDGTWLVEGLNSGLRYDVIGRRDGFNDVVVAGVTPTSMVDITYTGDITSNETFTGALGHLELVGGMPPYAASVVDPLPAGIFPVVNGRQLIIDGTTADDAVFNSTVRITSSNGVTKDVPVKLVVGFKAPTNLEAETIEDAGAFSVVLTWEVTNPTQEVLVFKSATPFDLDSMPTPIATLTGDAVSYTDDDVIEDDVFYYMAASVCEGFTLYSDEVRKVVNIGDPHWDKVVALLHFDGDLTDETGRTWTPIGSPAFADTAPMLDGKYLTQGGVANSGIILGTGDFTIECFFRARSASPRFIFLWDGRGSGGSDGPYPIVYMNGSDLILRNHVNGGATGPSSSVVIALNTSYHLAHVRKSGVSTLYLDGVNVGSAADATNYSLRSLHVAYNTSFGSVIDMDEFRITKGVARYTENFIPPTEPFPNK